MLWMLPFILGHQRFRWRFMALSNNLDDGSNAQVWLMVVSVWKEWYFMGCINSIQNNNSSPWGLPIDIRFIGIFCKSKMKICFISLSQYPYIYSVTSNLFCGNKGKTIMIKLIQPCQPLSISPLKILFLLYSSMIFKILANGYTDLIKN